MWFSLARCWKSTRRLQEASWRSSFSRLRPSDGIGEGDNLAATSLKVLQRQPTSVSKASGKDLLEIPLDEHRFSVLSTIAFLE